MKSVEVCGMSPQKCGDCVFVCVSACESFPHDRLHFCLYYTAGEDAADDSVSGVDVFTPAVFRCHALHPDE